MRPLYPLPYNPFYNASSGSDIYGLCAISAVLGLIYYAMLLVRGPSACSHQGAATAPEPPDFRS